MRDILYRGKRIDNDEWEVGYAVKGCDREGQMFIAKSIGVGFFTGGINAKEVKPETIVEFTGLYDKNGEMIFEGDIVKVTTGLEGYKSTYHSTNHRVKYDACNCGIAVFYPFDNSDMVEIEVIGNIYDNPELVEVEQ